MAIQQVGAVNDGEDNIASVVSRWTGILVAKLMEGEKDKLPRLPEHLHTGFDQAIIVSG